MMTFTQAALAVIIEVVGVSIFSYVVWRFLPDKKGGD